MPTERPRAVIDKSYLFDIDEDLLLSDSVKIAHKTNVCLDKYSSTNLVTLPQDQFSLLLNDSISPIPLHKTLLLLNMIREFDTNKTLKTPSIDQEENKQDRFPEIQKMVEQSTGYPMTQSDIEAINEMVKMGVVQEDISGAIEYFRGKDIVARGAQQILKSVRYQVAKRIQAFKAPAPETPKPTGKIMIELADGQIVEELLKREINMGACYLEQEFISFLIVKLSIS